MPSTIVAILEVVQANAVHTWLLNLAILSCSTYVYWVYRQTYSSTSFRRLSAENARGSGTGVPLTMTLQSSGSFDQVASSTSESSTSEMADTTDAQELPQSGFVSSSNTSKLRYILPTGEDVSRIFSQQGYKKSSLGAAFQFLWLCVPILSQAHLALIAIDRHVFRGSEAVGATFTFLFVLSISHIVLAAMCAIPSTFRAFFMLPCPLREADFVLVKEDDEEHSMPEARTSMNAILTYLFGDDRDQKATFLPVIRQDAHYFEYTGVRFLWSSNADRFRPVGTVFASGSGAWRVLQGGGAATSVVNDLRRTIGPNIANVDVPSLSSSLLSEFGDFLYVFQLACFWLFYVYAEWNLALVWLVFIGLLGLYRSLFFLRMAHLKVANVARELASKKETVLRSGKWVTVHAYDLVLGDLVQITESCISADLALVSGCVGVNESSLTGDAAPVQKAAVDRHGTWELDVHVHGKKHMLFCGTQVIRSIGDDSVEEASTQKAAPISSDIGTTSAPASLFSEKKTAPEHSDVKMAGEATRKDDMGRKDEPRKNEETTRAEQAVPASKKKAHRRSAVCFDGDMEKNSEIPQSTDIAVASNDPPSANTEGASEPSSTIATQPSVAPTTTTTSIASMQQRVRPAVPLFNEEPVPPQQRVEPCMELRQICIPEKKPEDNYEISEHGGDSDAEDSQTKDRSGKHVPKWCETYLETLSRQTDIDPDTIFGPRVPRCVLDDIFTDEMYKQAGKNRPKRARGSSGDWRKDQLARKEISDYKSRMGHARSWRAEAAS